MAYVTSRQDVSPFKGLNTNTYKWTEVLLGTFIFHFRNTIPSTFQNADYDVQNNKFVSCFVCV
jgi:hypothetical protein